MEQRLRRVLRRFAGMSPMPEPSGRFRQFPFDMVVHSLREWNPEFELSAATIRQVYALLNDYLEMDFDAMRAFVEPGAVPASPQPYPLEERLSRLRPPTLILSADREPLAAAYSRTVATVPHGAGHRFPDTHPLVSGRDEEYADVVGKFFTAPLKDGKPP